MGVSPFLVFVFIDQHRDTPALPFTHDFLRHRGRAVTFPELTQHGALGKVSPDNEQQQPI
jgi:hypothetical protein